jgi:ribosome-associated protein
MPQQIDFELRGDYIALAALLKSTGLADSGGSAKALVASGAVFVDGQQELRKTRKIRAGQTVVVGGARIRVIGRPS